MCVVNYEEHKNSFVLVYVEITMRVRMAIVIKVNLLISKYFLKKSKFGLGFIGFENFYVSLSFFYKLEGV